MCLGGFQLSVGCLILDVQLVENIFEWETTPHRAWRVQVEVSLAWKNHDFLGGLICSLPLKDGDAP